MNLDFTIDKFERLCEAISESDYEKLNIREYINKKEKSKKYIIFRHDIDEKVDRVLKMAEIEHKYGISSTYYIRMTDEVFKPEIIKEVEKLGHEIGYHYEVMDKAKGNPFEAIKIFEHELIMLRKLCRVDTICMHGNSRTPWNNRELWESYNFNDYGIIGEGYLTIDFSDLLYLSDTGRNWGNRFKVKDTIGGMKNGEILSKIKSTDDVINLINQSKFNKIYLLSHARWTNNFYDWSAEFVSTSLKNIVKLGIIKYRGSKSI